jgi:hypothetical protein
MQGYGCGSSLDGLAHPNQVCRVDVLDVHILQAYSQARHCMMVAQCPLAVTKRQTLAETACVHVQHACRPERLLRRCRKR